MSLWESSLALFSDLSNIELALSLDMCDLLSDPTLFSILDIKKSFPLNVGILGSGFGSYTSIVALILV